MPSPNQILNIHTSDKFRFKYQNENWSPIKFIPISHSTYKTRRDFPIPFQIWLIKWRIENEGLKMKDWKWRIENEGLVLWSTNPPFSILHFQSSIFNPPFSILQKKAVCTKTYRNDVTVPQKLKDWYYLPWEIPRACTPTAPLRSARLRTVPWGFPAGGNIQSFNFWGTVISHYYTHFFPTLHKFWLWHSFTQVQTILRPSIRRN